MRRDGGRKKKMTKIAPQEQKSHTLNNIVEHHHGSPATAFWQDGRDSIHCKGKRSTCSVWRCRLPSRTVVSPYLSSAKEQTRGGVDCCVCIPIHCCHRCSFLSSMLHFCFCMASCFLCMPIHMDAIKPTFRSPIHSISSVSLSPFIFVFCRLIVVFN